MKGVAGASYSERRPSWVELRITFWSSPTIITKIILEFAWHYHTRNRGRTLRSAGIRLGLLNARFSDVAPDEAQIMKRLDPSSADPCPTEYVPKYLAAAQVPPKVGVLRFILQWVASSENPVLNAWDSKF
jgi:hypothetical protein